MIATRKNKSTKNEEKAFANKNHISAHTEQQRFRTARDAKAVTDELHMSATKHGETDLFRKDCV